MSGTFRQTGSLVARTLPPELFEYICNAADGGSSSSRLVCQYWNRQCTPHVFRQIDVEESPERIRALWRHRAGPTFVRHMEIIKGVPYYERNSKFPWIHLLSQTSTSTESVWKSKWGSASRISIWGPDWPKVTSRISISGPFSGGHRTMRSVHFALPRFLPRALSCGIKNLYLNSEIHFRQFQDLLHLACELPDLEVLECKARFGSLPTEVWRRRPRTNRNKLRKCKFLGLQQTNETAESIYAPGMLHIALYMSVYDVDSFFVEMEVLPILALLEAIRPPGWPLTTCYSHDPQNHSQTLNFAEDTDTVPFLALHILRDAIHPTFKVAVDWSYKQQREAELEAPKWTDADEKFREITAPLRHAHFVLGFYDRTELDYFVETVLESDTPTIFSQATLRYGIYDRKAVEVGLKDDYGDDCEGAWRRASLDSEELTGTTFNFGHISNID